MALDPKKFAQLTTALAASIVVVGVAAVGCTITSTDSGNGDDDDTTSSSGATGASSSSGGSSSGTLDAGASSSSSGGSSSGGDAGETDAGPTCLGSTQAAPTCGEDGGGCLSADPSKCTNYASAYLPDVAQAIVDCLAISPTCEEGQEFEGTPTCAADAVARACPDATAAAYCDSVIEAAACGENQQLADSFEAKCLVLAPALTASGREVLAANAAEEGACDELSYFASSLDPSYSYILVPQEP